MVVLRAVEVVIRVDVHQRTKVGEDDTDRVAVFELEIVVVVVAAEATTAELNANLKTSSSCRCRSVNDLLWINEYMITT